MVFTKIAIIKNVLALPRFAKRGCVLVMDVVFSILSVWLALYLRLGDFAPLRGQAIWAVLASVSLVIPIFIKAGLYRSVFRYNGFSAMVSLGWAIFFYGVAFAAIFTFWTIDGVPRTVGLIQPILMFLLVGASRTTARVVLGRQFQNKSYKATARQTLIYGAGHAGGQLASAIANSSEICVVGFLDDDELLHGSLLNGLTIYNPADVAEVIRVLRITDVLLALPSVSHFRRGEILNRLKHHKVLVRTLPGLSDLAIGNVSLSDVRDLDVNDLLGRDPIKPDDLLLNLNTHGKTVLVTGAGGSIGSELCRQIIETKPKCLLLVEMSEFALYRIHQELQAKLGYDHPRSGPLGNRANVNVEFNPRSKGLQKPHVEIIPLLASVCDEGRIQRIMDTWRPDTVYHAAAYKHVPMVEHNPAEAVHNNIFGTRVCAIASLRNSVRNFVLISTDKAVRPTNIMGATKRMAEMVLQSLAEMDLSVIAAGWPVPSSRTIFSMVRFGNVLGSSGSVVPMFREQVKNGGPLTLTHVDMTRYFMTIPEAAQLVIQAGAMGLGGDVFVLDMGNPVKIMDLARRVVELSGLTVRDAMAPNGDIELTVIGLRPGEKLYEELLIGDNPEPTLHPRIMKANEPHMSWLDLEDKLNALRAAMNENDVLSIRKLLQETVKGYQPSGEVVDWVYMAREVKFEGFV